ncbi:MAG: flagellar basal body-associated FliL family protein [Pseudomonadota bacterium]
MTDASAAIEDVEEDPPKKSKGMLFGLIGAVLLGGATFFVIFSGIVPIPFGAAPEPVVDDKLRSEANGTEEHSSADYSDFAVAYVPIREMIISLGPNSQAKHLKLLMTIEVDSEAEQQVAALAPRIRDVLNTFLRAVDERDFEVPRAMSRLRGQMLRRVQLVTPPGAVKDLLIQDFVLN